MHQTLQAITCFVEVFPKGPEHIFDRPDAFSLLLKLTPNNNNITLELSNVLLCRLTVYS